MLAAMRLVVTLRGREHGEERHCPDPSGPGHRCQQHQAEPAQAAGLDEVPVRGANRITVDPFGGDARAAPALDHVVEPSTTGPRGTNVASSKRSRIPPAARGLQTARLSTR